MSRYCRDAVLMMTTLAASGCGHSQRHVAPSDPFTQIAVSQMSVAPLAGTNVLLLAAGGLVVGDSAHPLPELAGRHTALVEVAYAAIDSALRRDGREVNWLGLDEQSRAARRNPTLGIEPERFATQYLFDPKIDRIPDPLWSQIRTLAALTSARYVLAPAGVKISGAPGALTAAYVVVLADARSGGVLLRVRAQGAAAPTAEAALAAAAASLLATPLH
jgi:hypothetical protein